jgi:ABC-type nitrate/sulfonate/bicarbonate transport system substrate-binding protein
MIQTGGDEARPPDLTAVEIMGEMKRKGIALFMATGTILLSVLSLASCTKPAVPEKAEQLRIGVFADSICALVYIAQEQGFFKRHGLEVSIENYQAGAYAVDDVLAKKLDVATATGLVLALQGVKRDNLRAVGTISSSNNVEVVARRDRGIERPDDLRGKRIGVTKATAAAYFLSTFLSFRGILPSEIRTVDLKPSEIVTALSEGKIDAACSFPPFTDMMKKTLAGNGVSWYAQGGQDYYFLLITREDLIKTRPRMVSGLLEGVLDAEDFLKKHEKEAQGIVERTLSLNHDAVLNTWPKTHFRVRLDQALLTLMEDEARWAIQNKLVETKKIPNYLPFLYLEGLEKLRPDAVSVIH